MIIKEVLRDVMREVRDRLKHTRAGDAAAGLSREIASNRAYRAAHVFPTGDREGADLIRQAAGEGDDFKPRAPGSETPTHHRRSEAQDPRSPFPDRSVPLLEYMGIGIDDHVRNFEPVLAQRILDLMKDKWTIVYTDVGRGSSTNRPNRLIRIDGAHRGDVLKTARTLAHEVNHAHPDGYVTKRVPRYKEDGEKKTRDDWENESMDEHMRGEGHAKVEERVSRDRTLANGGPDIGIDTNDPVSDYVYHRYRSGEISLEEASEAFGQLCRVWPGAHGVEGPIATYDEFYREQLAERWNIMEKLEELEKLARET
ncbi:hypothetical protein ACFZC5_34710 [Nocardia gamkensis]|uniref:hypothetical protein n=1 Tax=Nocardia gamkensis TaxID=352869 RepID=UPI0036E55542